MSLPKVLVVALAALTLAAGCVGAPDDSGADEVTGSAEEAGSLVGLATFKLSATTVTGGGSVTGTVTLSSKAQANAGYVTVYVSFPNTLLAGPRWVRIPNGATSGTFTLRANPYLTTSSSVTIGANTQNPEANVYLSQTLSVTPAATLPSTPAPLVQAVTFAPSTVKTGASSTGTLTLSGPAPSGGAAVQIYNPNDTLNLNAEPPAVVIVPAGATSATFTVPTHLPSYITTSAQDSILGNYFGSGFAGSTLTITR